MNQLRNRARETGKTGMVLQYGVVGFGGLLIAVNSLRFLIGHGLSVSALASREFAGMMLQTLIGAPLMGALWGTGDVEAPYGDGWQLAVTATSLSEIDHAGR